MRLAAQLIWANPQWLWPAVIAGLVLAALIAFSDGRQPGAMRWKVLLISLKWAAVALLLVSLLRPMRQASRPQPQANLAAIVLDNSQSMQLQSASDGQSLGQTFQAFSDDQSSWRTRLAQTFDVRMFGLDGNLSATDSITDLPLDGTASKLDAGLTELQRRLAGRPVAGVLLMSDGHETGGETENPAARAFIRAMTESPNSPPPFPIYPVVPNEYETPPDIRLIGETVTQTDFEAAPVTIRARVVSTRPEPHEVLVRLIDPAGETVDQTVLRCSPEEPREASFRFRPQKSGVHFYRLVAVAGEDESLVDPLFDSLDGKPLPPSEGEVTMANNVRSVMVHRRGGPYRVLYVAGRPNWEFKFLRRSLQSDPEVELVGLIRIAKKEPKFSFRDSKVRGTNPLFAGLDEEDAELRESIDEPVILRLGVREGDELQGGFPDTAEELFAFHAVVLDDLEPEFFTQDQMLLLRRFVADRGGGLLMLGGQESFDPKTFSGTPLADLSPVYPVRRTKPPTKGDNRAKLQLTREGILQPWLRLRETEAAERERLLTLPSPATVNPVGPVKPGASELIELVNAEGQAMLALATQPYGKGRTAAMMIGDWWRTHLRSESANGDQSTDDPKQTWRQIVRWITGQVPRRVEVDVQPDSTDGHLARLRVQVRDEVFRPLENARVELEFEPERASYSAENAQVSADPPISDPAEEQPSRTEPLQIIARPSSEALGVYETDFVVDRPGGVQVTARVTTADGNPLDASQTGWVADPRARELQRLGIDRVKLEQIAADSGGRVIRVDEIDDWVDGLAERPALVAETWVYPLWHQPWVMLTAIVCLCAAWGLRRWKGWA